MSLKTYIKMKGKKTTELKLNIDELVDANLRTHLPLKIYHNIDVDSIDIDDVASPTIKLSDAKHRASLLSSSLVDNY